MTKKKAAPLTVEAVRKILAKRDPDDPTRDGEWSNLPISILCDNSPEDAPQIVDRVLQADAPGRFADALRTDEALLRTVIRLLTKEFEVWTRWKDLREGLAMFEEAMWLQRDWDALGNKKTGRGRRPNVFALERGKETFYELTELQHALTSGQGVPRPYPKDEFEKQAAEIQKLEAALRQMEGSWSAEYQKARKDFKTESFVRAAIILLDHAHEPHTKKDAVKLIARVKKSVLAFERQVEPLRPK